MKRLAKFKTQVLLVIERIRNQATDDSIEGQAKAFRLWAVLSAIALITWALSAGTNDQNRDGDKRLKQIELARFIPDGMVLMPITPINLEVLQSMVAESAWVDLYSIGLNGGRGVRVAKSVRLVRAPNSPNRFAVILRDSPDEKLLVASDPVIVIVRKGPVLAANSISPKSELGRTRTTRKTSHIQSLRDSRTGVGLTLIQEKPGDSTQDQNEEKQMEENDENV